MRKIFFTTWNWHSLRTKEWENQDRRFCDPPNLLNYLSEHLHFASRVKFVKSGTLMNFKVKTRSQDNFQITATTASRLAFELSTAIRIVRLYKFSATSSVVLFPRLKAIISLNRFLNSFRFIVVWHHSVGFVRSRLFLLIKCRRTLIATRCNSLPPRYWKCLRGRKS